MCQEGQVTFSATRHLTGRAGSLPTGRSSPPVPVAPSLPSLPPFPVFPPPWPCLPSSVLSGISLKCVIYCPALSEQRCHENLNKQINNLEELCVYSVHDWAANISLKQTLTHKVEHKKHNSRGRSGGGGPEPHRLPTPPPTARRPSPGHPAPSPGPGGHGRKNIAPQDTVS